MDFRTRRACPTDECRSERGEESLLTQVLWIKQAIPEKMGALEEKASFEKGLGERQIQRRKHEGSFFREVTEGQGNKVFKTIERGRYF